MLTYLLNDLYFATWLLANTDRPEVLPYEVIVEGAGPFLWRYPQPTYIDLPYPDSREGWLEEKASAGEDIVFSDLLTEIPSLEVEVFSIDDLDGGGGVIIVGRDNWSEEALEYLVSFHAGSRLRVYSEEMFLAFLLTGCDPFDEPAETILQLGAGHPALEFLMNFSSGFDWPTTYVSPSFGGSSVLDLDLSKDSLPGILGYRVGKTSPLSPAQRQAILGCVLQIQFTPVLHDSLAPGYLDTWGKHGTPERLHQLALWLAAMCTLEKRRMMTRGHDLSVAVKDREDDLAWLKSKYYHGRFSFRWPSTFVEEV
jgi:hypothetical protein